MDYFAKFPVYLSSFIHKIITDYVLDDFKNEKVKLLGELKEKTKYIKLTLDNFREHVLLNINYNGHWFYKRYKYPEVLGLWGLGFCVNGK